MSPHRKTPSRLWIVLAALCVLPIVGFVAALPWLKQQPDEVVFLVTGVTATLVIVASFFLDVLLERQMDEWQRSNQRFSIRWGWGIGSSLIALLLAAPVFHDVIVHWAAIWGEVPNPDRRLVLVTFTFGFMTVVIAQTIGIALLSIGWTLWKSRPARDLA